MTPSVEDHPGKRIGGKYELIEPIGEGGMASVWRGLTHGAAGFSRSVAIKRVLPSYREDENFLAMFVEEARVVSELHHPNIVQIHDFDRDELGAFFIVMEWVNGLDIRRYSQAFFGRGESTPWPYVSAIGIEVLRALSVAHERTTHEGEVSPIFHRDVSPTNILIGINGIVKLADFGLARASDRRRMTQPGIVKGKLAYLAPEMVLGDPASQQTDIYGLGIVLWEALAGRRLFGGGNDVDIIRRVRDGDVERLDSLRDDLPEDLVDIIHCALSKYPDDRFSSARQMQQALSRLLRGTSEATDAQPLGRSVRYARLRSHDDSVSERSKTVIG